MCQCHVSVHPARELLPFPVSYPHSSHPAQLHIRISTRFPSLSLCSFHPFVVSTPALPILVTFLSMACVLKRFPLTSPRKLALTCVKRGFLRTPGPHRTSQLSPCALLCRSAMSMRCLAGMCHAPSPPHHRLLPLANSCLALFPTPQLPPCAIPHLPPTHFPSSPYSLSFTLPTRFPSLSRLSFHPFVVSTPAISNSSHDFFHDVRTKTFSAHVTT